MITINGEPLPQEAIEFEYRRLVQYYSQHMSAEQIKQQEDRLRAQAREQAIGAKLLLNEAQRLDLQVPTEMIDKKLQPIIEQSGGREPFEQRLKENNITEEQLRQNMEQGCKVDVLIEKVCEGLSDPTEEEMQTFYKENQENYLQPERVAASHILVRPASDKDEDRVTAESKIEGIADELKNGKDFAELAAVHSECPSGKQNGGSLGWFSRGMMVPEFENAAFAMNVGEMSDIIETQFGYHVILKTAEDEGGQASFTESQDKIRDVMRHDRRGKCLAAFVEDLKEKATIAENPEPA